MEEVKNIIETAEDRSLYEVGFHILPSLAEEGMLAKYEEVKALIVKHGGKVVTEGTPSMTDLSYTMIKVIDNKHERFDTAYFGWITFDIEPKDVLTLKEELDQHIDILRFLIVLTVEDSESKVAPILKEKKMPEKKIEAPHEKEEAVPVAEKELDDKLKEMVE